MQKINKDIRRFEPLPLKFIPIRDYDNTSATANPSSNFF